MSNIYLFIYIRSSLASKLALISPEQWVAESFLLASEFVYLDLQPGQILSVDYIDASRRIVLQQVCILSSTACAHFGFL